MIVLFLGKHHHPGRPLPEESCVHVAGVAVPLDPFHPPSQDGHCVLIPEGRKTDGSMGKSFALTCKRSDTSSSLLASHLGWDRSCPSPEPQKTAQRSAQRCSVLLLLGLNHVGMGIGLFKSFICWKRRENLPFLPRATHSASATAAPSKTRGKTQKGWSCKLFGKTFKMSHVILNPLKLPTPTFED